ncbi:MAG: CRISPR-associated protein Cas4 [Candidatus Hydrothermarchaeota archaeon]
MLVSGSDGELLDVWLLTQYYYCPRKIYFLVTMNVPHVPRKKMEFGSLKHESEKERLKERKTVYGFDPDKVEKVDHNVYAENEEYGIKGQIDTVLFLKSGDILVVDVKYSDFQRVFFNWRKQMVAYSLLAEAKYGKKIKKGLVYSIPKRKSFTIIITESDRLAIKRDVENINSLIMEERIPNVTKGKQCRYCEVEKYCA